MLEPTTFEAYISPSSVLCFSTSLGNQSPSEKDVLVLYDVKGKMGLGPCPSTYCNKPDSPSNMGASANEAEITTDQLCNLPTRAPLLLITLSSLYVCVGGSRLPSLYSLMVCFLEAHTRTISACNASSAPARSGSLPRYLRSH